MVFFLPLFKWPRIALHILVSEFQLITNWRIDRLFHFYRFLFVAGRCRTNAASNGVFFFSLSFFLWCHHRKREKQKFTIKNWNYKLLPHRVEVSFYPHSISSSSSSFLCICVLVCVGETNHQRIFKQNV